MDLPHPLNAGILRYLGAADRLARTTSVAGGRASTAPAQVPGPYLRLGTHPELVERLWDELGGGLPRDCRWVVYGAPALVHPDSGVVFAFAGGTHAYALRLPPAERAAALAAGAALLHPYPGHPELGIAPSVLDLDEIGPEWVLGGWFAEEPRWCAAAYVFAANS